MIFKYCDICKYVTPCIPTPTSHRNIEIVTCSICGTHFYDFYDVSMEIMNGIMDSELDIRKENE